MTSFLRNALCLRTRISRIYSTPNATRSLSTEVPQSPALPRHKPLSILEDDSTTIDLTEDDDLVNGARPGTDPLHLRSPSTKATPAEWRAHRQTIKELFPNGWSPPRKISREAMYAVRQLNKLEPERFTTAMLAEKFKISPEAVRRILKSKWEPPKEKKDKLVEREKKLRGERIEMSKMKERRESEHLLMQDEPVDSWRRPNLRGDRLTLGQQEESYKPRDKTYRERPNGPPRRPRDPNQRRNYDS